VWLYGFRHITTTTKYQHVLRVCIFMHIYKHRIQDIYTKKSGKMHTHTHTHTQNKTSIMITSGDRYGIRWVRSDFPFYSRGTDRYVL
jgi:hypothetical protein